MAPSRSLPKAILTFACLAMARACKPCSSSGNTQHDGAGVSEPLCQKWPPWVMAPILNKTLQQDETARVAKHCGSATNCRVVTKQEALPISLSSACVHEMQPSDFKLGRLISVACAWPECCSTRRVCVGSSPMRIWSRCWAPPDMGLCGVTMICCEALPWAPGGRVNSAVVCVASQRGAAPPVVPKKRLQAP